MNLFELTCPGCDAVYRVAESSHQPGPAETLTCAICAEVVGVLEAPRLRAIKLAVPPEATGTLATLRGPFPLI